MICSLYHQLYCPFYTDYYSKQLLRCYENVSDFTDPLQRKPLFLCSSGGQRSVDPP